MNAFQHRDDGSHPPRDPRRAPPDMGNMWVPPGHAPPAGPARAAPERIGAPRHEPQRRRRWLPPLLALLAAAVLVLAYGIDNGWITVPRPDVGISDVPTAADSPPPRQPDAAPIDAAAVGALIAPSLVDISVTVEPLGLEGAGTGILLTPDGQVLTSHHVIKGASSISVTAVGNGASYDATTLGYDSAHDVALIKLDGAGGLPAAHLGDSTRVLRGDQLVAVGNAGGAGGQPSSVGGPVTDLNATVVARNEADLSRKNLTGLIEVQAPVVAGQSGGSLVDRGGNVVGLVTAATGPSVQQPQDKQGYAIPLAQALAIADTIRRGTPTDDVHIGPTATLGVVISDVGRAATPGARVDLAMFDTPAAGAGLQEGDVITAIDGRAVDSVRAVRAVVSRHRPGDTINLTWTDTTGRSRTAAIQLEEGPPN